MKIATFNINNVNKRLANLLAWLADGAARRRLPAGTEGRGPRLSRSRDRGAGYGAVWVGQRTWNGVAILARGADAGGHARTSLPGDAADAQARYIEAAVNGVLIASIYLPNGNPNPGPKFAYKLAWLERLIAHAASCMAAGVPVVLAGDYNVVPTEADIYQPNHWEGDALVAPRKRAPLPAAAGPGLDRRTSHGASRRSALDLLVLPAEPLAERQRPAARSSAAQPGSRRPAGCRRRRSVREGRGGGQRPCAGLDRAGDGLMAALAVRAGVAEGDRPVHPLEGHRSRRNRASRPGVGGRRRQPRPRPRVRGISQTGLGLDGRP